jgi:hypothetical protein
MSLYKNEVIVAIEKIVEQQVEASGITGELHRLDGEKIVDAIMEQLEGFVLVPEDQAKDTERLNFLLGGADSIRTVVQRDIQNADYEVVGNHHLFTEVYWIDGWDYHENTSAQSERGAIDKAMIEAQEQSHE